MIIKVGSAMPKNNCIFFIIRLKQLKTYIIIPILVRQLLLVFLLEQHKTTVELSHISGDNLEPSSLLSNRLYRGLIIEPIPGIECVKLRGIENRPQPNPLSMVKYFSRSRTDFLLNGHSQSLSL